jgi:TIR domain
MAQVFVSYGRPDEEVATRLYHDLQQHGHQPWMDRFSLLPGEMWRNRIREAIRDSSHFVALLSSRSVHKRGFFQSEMRLAFEVLQEMPKGQIYLIPARLDDCEPSFELREFHRVDLFPDYDAGLTAIICAISRIEPSAAVPDDDPSYLSALGLFKARLYSDAASRFGAVVKRLPNHAEARYYLVLSALAGKRPKLLDQTSIERIECHLAAAVAQSTNSDGHAQALWALVKADYYMMNGLADERPTIAELMNRAADVTPNRVLEITSAIHAPDNEVWAHLHSHFVAISQQGAAAPGNGGPSSHGEQ